MAKKKEELPPIDRRLKSLYALVRSANFIGKPTDKEVFNEMFGVVGLLNKRIEFLKELRKKIEEKAEVIKLHSMYEAYDENTFGKDHPAAIFFGPMAWTRLRSSLCEQRDRTPPERRFPMAMQFNDATLYLDIHMGNDMVRVLMTNGDSTLYQLDEEGILKLITPSATATALAECRKEVPCTPPPQ